MTITGTGFGWIETDAGRFDHDIIVFRDCRVENRYDRLSGSNHEFSPAEATAALAGTTADIVFGTGQYGAATVPDSTHSFLAGCGARLHVAKTPKAIVIYNRLTGSKCGVFHITC